MKSKTIKEWLEELPDGYRERALVNAGKRSSRKKYKTMWKAVYSAFVWHYTDEDWKFWNAVADHYLSSTPLPPLP